jgi:hypothetical protein
MTTPLGVMEVPAPVEGDSIRRYETGTLPDGGLWTALRRLSDHDHTGGLNGAPISVASIPDGSITVDKLDPSVFLPYALTDGSKPFTGMVTMEADATVRDTLYFGEQGTALPPDVALARTAPGQLKNTGGMQPHFEARSGAGTTSARFGQSGADQVVVAFNALMNPAGSDWNRDDPAKPAALWVAEPNGALIVYRPNPGSNPVQWLTALKVNYDGNAGLGINPPAFGAPYAALYPGTSGIYGSPISPAGGIRQNSYYDGASNRSVVAGAGVDISLANGAFHLYLAPPVAAGNDLQTMVDRFIVNNDGQVTVASSVSPALSLNTDMKIIGTLQTRMGSTENLSGMWNADGADARKAFVGLDGVPNFWRVYTNIAPQRNLLLIDLASGQITTGNTAGYPALYMPPSSVLRCAGQLNIDTLNSSHLVLSASSNYVIPNTDNGQHFGHPAVRWIIGYFVQAPAIGSSLDLKQDISPLDPAACVASVLGTDWVDYTYKPMAPPERAEETSDEDWETQQQAYLTMVADTASSRRQKGYVLDSPDHRVGDLFGLPDRKNRSDGADLAVVACALQDVLRRLAALEGKAN